MAQTIDTASALEKMRDTWDESTGQPKTYGLRFVSKNGFREIYNARRAVKNPQQRAEGVQSGPKHAHLQFKGLVQVYDDDIKEFRDIKFAQIIAFRDYNSTQWQLVKLI